MSQYKPYIQCDKTVNVEFMTTVSMRYNNCILYTGNVHGSTKFSHGCINIVCGVEKMSIPNSRRLDGGSITTANSLENYIILG
jgi:hypothetical protein